MSYATTLQAGTLNRLVEVQQRSTAVDSFGQQAQAWTTLFTARASIEPLSGSETVAAGMQVGQVMYQVVMRYRPGMAASLRLLYQGRVFNILSVQDDFTKHRKLTLLCNEGETRG